MKHKLLKLIFLSNHLNIQLKVVTTKTTNHPKRAKTSQNEPKPPIINQN